MSSWNLRDVGRLLASVVVCQCAGLAGSVFTMRSIPGWYETLTKPSITPPNWLFAPVWTLLYFMMGVAVFLILRGGKGERRARLAIALFASQLVLNVLWSLVFFGLRSTLGGVVEIAFLWCAIALTAGVFFGISKAAGVLLLPYLIWVSYAALLNILVWRLNP